jgi:hypothetical protein
MKFEKGLNCTAAIHGSNGTGFDEEDVVEEGEAVVDPD